MTNATLWGVVQQIRHSVKDWHANNLKLAIDEMLAYNYLIEGAILNLNERLSTLDAATRHGTSLADFHFCSKVSYR